MVELLVRPLADAFMQVGVFVALLLLAFGVLQWRTGDRAVRFLASRWRSAPLVGALLGVSPGCGGAILVMPLYARGTVSFGTVVAALVATMGDSSFVLIAADPGLALVVHAVLLAAGVVCGYAVDALGIRPRLPVSAATGGSTVGSAEAIPPPRRSATVPRSDPGAVLLCAVAAVAAVVAVPVVFQAVDSTVLARASGGVDPYLVLGVAGTLACALYLGKRPCGLGDDSLATVTEKVSSFQGVLRHAARETAFVTVWVTVAYLATTWILALDIIDLAGYVAAAGIAGVAVGAAVGVIPGCALQIVLTGLYTTGALPLPTLLANAVSQDGDALFPLLSVDRRSAVVASLVTTVPALVVGAVALGLGL